MPFSLRARVVFPVDRPPIAHGVVTIDGERIVAVGTESDGGELTDLGSVALFPGLVNAHTHLEFNYLRQPLGQPEMPLVDWIRHVIAERGRRDTDSLAAIEDGVRESLGCGVTSIGDISTAEVLSNAAANVDLTSFAEVIGFSLARAESAFSAAQARLELVGSHRGISPHAPYTVSPDLLKRLVGLASERDLPVAMHVAESQEEIRFLATGSGAFRDLLEDRSMWDANAVPHGGRPLNYLHMLAAAPRSLVIHGNYLDSEELSFLGAIRTQMSLVYCPRTHAFFGHGPYPLQAALAARVLVALGTDSRASNPDLDLLAEMRRVVCIHSWIDPQQVLRMGTLSGAQALGRDRDVGSITEGKLANLIAMPIAGKEQTTPDDILAEILAAETTPSAVYLAGRPLNA